MFYFSNPHNVILDPNQESILISAMNTVFLMANQEPKGIELTLVSEGEIRELNKSYRGKNTTTDVISFPMDVPGSPFLGEMYICTAVLVRQAKEYKQSDVQELMFLFVHGLLHLLGYDHETNNKDKKRMFALQDAICKEF